MKDMRAFEFREDGSQSSMCSTVTVDRDITKRKRRISFGLDNNQVFEIPHVKEMDEQELKDVWYMREDYESMKQGFIPFIRALMKGEEVEENDEQTTRGLEFRTRKGAIRRQHNKLQAMTAVLDEQERQTLEGTRSDVLVMEAYKACADHCQEEAHQLGCQDEIDRKLVAWNHGEDLAIGDKKHRGGLSKLFKSMRRAVLSDIRSLNSSDRKIVVSLAA